MRHISIRQAEPSDAPVLINIIHIAMKGYTKESGITAKLASLEETASDLINYMKSDMILLALYDGIPAGTIRVSASKLNDSGNKSIAEISRFAVLPQFQRSGVGSRLFDEAINRTAAIGYTKAVLYTALSNQRTIRFYESKGFILADESEACGYARGRFEKYF